VSAASRKRFGNLFSRVGVFRQLQPIWATASDFDQQRKSETPGPSENLPPDSFHSACWPRLIAARAPAKLRNVLATISVLYCVQSNRRMSGPSRRASLEGHKARQVDCCVAPPRGGLRMDQTFLTVIIQCSRMDRGDRGAGHHLLDLQGRERWVQLPKDGEIVEYRLDHGIDQFIRLTAR
jgi:hypothetical protein